MRASKWFRFLAVGVFAAALGLAGCAGDDGSRGPKGDKGDKGDPGEAGGVTATNESCVVCHGTGAIEDVAVTMPDPTRLDLTVSNLKVTNVGGVARVSFNLKRGTANFSGLTGTQVRLYMADLVPAGAAANPESSDYFKQWAQERATAGTSNAAWTSFDATDAANGNYVITMSTPLANAVDAADAQRVFLRITGVPDSNNTAGILDFKIPADGATVSAADLPQYQKAYVTVQACQKCHGPFGRLRNDGTTDANVAHGNGYVDTRACVICHSPLLDDPAEPELPAMINASRWFHKIHGALDVEGFLTRIWIDLNHDGIRTDNERFGWSKVTFPQHVQSCVVCHNDGGNDLSGTAAKIDNWKNHPSRAACGSCHEEEKYGGVNFATGENHGGGAQANDNSCSGCHPPSGPGFGKSVTDAHEVVTDPRDAPEFDVTLSLTPDKTYVAGEAPLITVTLKNHADGSNVNPAFYTTPQGPAGNTGDTALRVASVAIYGPRSKSVPILATNTVTDPAFVAGSIPTQYHNLFVGGTDPLVKTDATGFKYQTLAIPEGMKPGTYMVRVRIGDYGRVGTNDYHVESIAFTNIQIGTADVEKKVAGDVCGDCHGNILHDEAFGPDFAEFHNERHAVVFDTDQCLSCHDQSGNHAVPLANRVHAVHSTNSTGDLYFVLGEGTRDWSDITFPRGSNSLPANERALTCITCHTSGNTSYKTHPFMMPCAGCHVGEQGVDGGAGVLDHMRQNGGPF